MVVTETNQKTTPKMTQKPHSTGQPVGPQRIMQAAWGFTVPLMIESGVKHRVFDLLDKGPRTLEQLTAETGASQRGLRILCNALVGIDLLRKEDDRYALTAESQAFLVSGKPGFQGGIFKHISNQLVPAWLKLDEIVRTGKPQRAVNEQTTGGEFFQKFVEDIFPMSYPAATALAGHLKLADAKQPVRVLDIAAGSGVWGIALAESSLQVRVTAVDWPAVIPVTKRIAKRHDVADRFTYLEGDMSKVDLGTGHTIATLGHIIHSEGEQSSRTLLKRVFNALAPGGTVVVSEWTPNQSRTGPADALIFAVNMLVNTDEGDTYTFEELRSWLSDAGFTSIRQFEAPAPSPLILATKPH